MGNFKLQQIEILLSRIDGQFLRSCSEIEIFGMYLSEKKRTSETVLRTGPKIAYSHRKQKYIF